MISTAQLDLQARDTDGTVGRATAVVVDAGGSMFSESASLTSAQHAHVVFEVPPTRFADVLARVSADRLRQLQANRGGVSDLLNVENQLTQREGQVDSLAGELGARRAQVDRATITVDVTPTAEKAVARPPAPGPGFRRGLRAGSRAFAARPGSSRPRPGSSCPFCRSRCSDWPSWSVVRRRQPATP